MIRTASALAAMALVASGPALADTPAKSDVKAFTAELSHSATAQSMRELLAKRGYITTSEFRRTGDGTWLASAMKSGSPVSIALKMPPRIEAGRDALTN